MERAGVILRHSVEYDISTDPNDDHDKDAPKLRLGGIVSIANSPARHQASRNGIA
jgi:hypothetical protein